jgi:hypothetical protein
MSNKKNKEESKEFPGYPHYPAKDDIMNSKENQRLDVDVENLSRSKNIPASTLPDQSMKTPITEPGITADEDIDKPAATDADLTPDDLIALSAEGTEYESLRNEDDNDLDIPGAEADDADEEIGEEDEENNYYSLGGDAHDNLEEDKG